jgi:hypothetical protein
VHSSSICIDIERLAMSAIGDLYCSGWINGEDFILACAHKRHLSTRVYSRINNILLYDNTHEFSSCITALAYSCSGNQGVDSLILGHENGNICMLTRIKRRVTQRPREGASHDVTHFKPDFFLTSLLSNPYQNSFSGANFGDEIVQYFSSPVILHSFSSPVKLINCDFPRGRMAAATETECVIICPGVALACASEVNASIY